MRYDYTVTKEGGEANLTHAMSWKKAIKKVLLMDSKFSGWITYLNKEGHMQQRSFKNGKLVHERKRN